MAVGATDVQKTFPATALIGILTDRAKSLGAKLVDWVLGELSFSKLYPLRGLCFRIPRLCLGKQASFTCSLPRHS